jgi:plasmid stabilization system protein ParE
MIVHYRRGAQNDIAAIYDSIALEDPERAERVAAVGA